MSNTLRILTLNIWNYNDPWPKPRALITETIQKHKPDLIGFQEIRHSGEHDEDGTVKEITQFISQYPSTTPDVLVGDFNEISDQEPIRHIAEQSEFIDAWANQHSDDPGWTYTTENTYVKNRNDERKGHRIDYIFVRPSQNGRGQILNCQRIADQSDADGHFPSDHFGLIVDLSLEKPE